jgi:hypothetical protein
LFVDRQRIGEILRAVKRAAEKRPRRCLSAGWPDGAAILAVLVFVQR